MYMRMNTKFWKKLQMGNITFVIFIIPVEAYNIFMLICRIQLGS